MTPFLNSDWGIGGIATFLGVTRHESDPQHGSVITLDYEAYPSMAIHQMDNMAKAAASKWGCMKVAMIHRLGSVPVGEVSVAIGVACVHRAEAFEACRWLIDSLKRDVPIWKKDVFADGYTRWVDPGNTKCADPDLK